jgi:hypothetical protein
MKHLHSNRKRIKAAMLACGFITASCFTFAQDDEKEEVFELSPFTIDASQDSGYYASQTMAGGRLSGSLKDTGAAVQVITKEFMEDLGATGIEELLQYTTSSEVAGILGNFTGADEGGLGETNGGNARRDPDATSRIRGLARPDRTRNFFVTDIPFDSYNTERIDINRGSNSFLFGLGSPAGLINNEMSRARFKDSTEFGTRIGSGGKSPSYRGHFKLNRVILEDKLAINVAGLMDRTEYRQRPTYKNDDRIYAAFTYRPFGNANTAFRGHMETGEIIGNAPDVLLPQMNFDTFLRDPARQNATQFVKHARSKNYAMGARNHEGPSLGQITGQSKGAFKNWSQEERDNFYAAGYIPRNTGGPADAQYPELVYRNIRWGGGAYGFVWDGSNGLDQPAFSYSDQITGSTIERRSDPKFNEEPNYWSGGPAKNNVGQNGGAPQGMYPGNLGEIMGIGWLDHGYTDLDSFDFSRANLGWDNDYYTRDFFNYNFGMEQTFWEGNGGFSIDFDFQDLYRDSYTALNGGNSVITFDVNETILLPEDPNYAVSGNYNGLPNPNFGRPVVMTKASERTNDDQRTAKRFTGFVKHDFKDSLSNDKLANLLGNHTLTVLADESRHHEMMINWFRGSFGDPEPALHIGPANARQALNNARNTPNMVYLGPPQPEAWTSYNSISDFEIYPAKYDLRSTTNQTYEKLTWNLGPDSDAQALADDTDRSNGNEKWVNGTWTPINTPSKNVRRQQTTVKSMAVNSQSKFFSDHLVLNLGYREDTVENFLNTEPPFIPGNLDEIPDVDPDVWLLQGGERTTTNSISKSIFGYGAVVYWPKDIIPLPEMVDDITFHYNTSDNFVPSLDRVDQYRDPIDSQFGDTTDWGISAYMFNNKFVARINFYDANLENASSPASGIFNRNHVRIFQWYGRLNRDSRRFDSYDNATGEFLFQGDGLVDPEIVEERITFDEEEGLYYSGDSEDADGFATLDEAIAAEWPFLEATKAAREPLEKYVFDERLIHSFNARFLPDGDINIQWAGAISDTTNINSKGMEAEFVINPSKNWRIAFNAAKQEVVLTDIAPRLGVLVEDFLLPYMKEFGHLDWGNPTGTPAGANFSTQTSDRLVEYFYLKGLEGVPTAEQRKWRYNLVTNYQFREGGLKGFSFGGAARWQDKVSGGYPIVFHESTQTYRPVVNDPYWTDTDLAIDLTFGYRKKIWGNVDWRMQINMRNVHNWDNTDVDIIRYQPNGAAARARFAPPRQIMLTNTFRF